MSARLLGIALEHDRLSAVVVADDGRILGRAHRSLTLDRPGPGRVEQDAEAWWQALCAVVPEALGNKVPEALGIKVPEALGNKVPEALGNKVPEALAETGPPTAVAITAQPGLWVLTDRDDSPLRPVILPDDRRSIPEARELEDRFGESILATTLAAVGPDTALAQIGWLQRHEPDLVDTVVRMHGAKDWLRHRLTGAWGTDRSEVMASRMGDAGRGGWSFELCGRIGWPLERTPPMRPPLRALDTVTAEAARATGLPEGVPVAVGVVAPVAEALAAGAHAPGQAVIALGRRSGVHLVCHRPIWGPPLVCLGHDLGDHPLATLAPLPGLAARDALAAQWFAGHDAAADALDQAADQIPVGAEGLICRPHLHLSEAPHWPVGPAVDLIGLGPHHGPGHVARALHEGVAFGLAEALATAAAEGPEVGEVRVLGAAGARWIEAIAAALDRPVHPVAGDAATGAALIAGLAAGIWPEPEACPITVGAPVAPDPATASTLAERRPLWGEIRRTLAPLVARL